MILETILANKRLELEAVRARVSPEDMAKRATECTDPTRGFRDALRTAPVPRIIAEIKRRSPTKGEIRPDFDPVACAVAYADAGAAAISVLTDEKFFGGHLDHLGSVRQATRVPILRKDFILDRYQVDEARVAGADALLLLAGVLPASVLTDLRDHAASLGLDALVEVHDEAELERALECGATLIGINNRDLRTFETDLAVTERLVSSVGDDCTIVSESGIFTPADVSRLTETGVHAFLVGESLMREQDIGAALRRLRRIS
jgi:indole-3-glycerol phosphate synthase